MNKSMLQGRFHDYPKKNKDDLNTQWFRSLKYDVCDPSGCFVELCIQLAIILIGKQIVNNCMGIALP